MSRSHRMYNHKSAVIAAIRARRWGNNCSQRVGGDRAIALTSHGGHLVVGVVAVFLLLAVGVDDGRHVAGVVVDVLVNPHM